MSEHPELSIIDTAELAELRGHAREIKRLQHQVAQQRYALDMAQRERDKTGRAVNEGLRKERDDARAELARRNIQIGDRDETIFNLNRTLSESERQVVELRRQRDDFGTQCAQHRDSLDAKARQIYDLEQQVDGRNCHHSLLLTPGPDGSYNISFKKETR